MIRHPGEAETQRRAGFTRDGWGSAGVRAEIPEAAADFLRRQRLLVIGAADDEGAIWADIIARAPGGPEVLAAAVDDRTIMVAGLPGLLAPLFGPPAREIGMLAIEPAARRRIRVNGTARREGARLIVRTDQVYANCPKYIQAREIIEAGPAPARGDPRRATGLDRRQRAWLGRADTFFVATRAPGHGADVSHRGGNPGFVHVAGPRRLSWPDYAGNSMYMTLGNLAVDPACGLLFLDWDAGHALHLTGTARVDWDPARAAAVPGARRVVEFDVDQVVEIPGAVPLRWRFGSYHRFNPAAARAG